MRPRAFASAAALAVASFAAAAGAQNLARLKVVSFSMQADTVQPRVGVPFHIAFRIRIAEQIGELDNVILPPLDGLEILGDEEHLVASASGTDYREVVTVQAQSAGRIAVGAARLDAIDARDGKPKQFLSTTPTGKDALILNVAGPPVPAARTAEHALRDALSAIGGAIVVALLAWLVLARRRPELPGAPEQATQPAADRALEVPQPPTIAQIAERLRDRPDRASAVWARAQLWARVGAPEGATLRDVQARPQAAQPQMRARLAAAERAAFTRDEDVDPAIAALIATMVST